VTTATETVTEKETKSYSYDETPYESYPFPQSHPDRLATMATLFGMTPKPIENCRVLELGCASGGNLIPMAFTLPGSQFVGIELSEKQVAEGRKAIEGIGLKNIEIKHESILDVNKDLGMFDYIIVHGVFSWVPDHVQDKIMEICQELLAPNGVAYISYNTYPGWHYRGMIRDMMLYHTEPLKEPAAKAQQARALLDFLSTSVPTENHAFGIMLKNELDMLRQQKDYYLLHDYLEEANTPLYFHQFAERASKADLQYLAEADFSTMLASNFSKEVAETLKRIANDIVRTEQYMDFVRNRTFRQTLLCRKDVVLNRNLTPESITKLFVSSSAKPENDQFDPNLNAQERFSMPDGKTFSTAYPLVRAAFHHLYSVFPQCVPFEELLTVARAKVASEKIQDANAFNQEKLALAGDLLTCYTIGISNFRTSLLPFVSEITAHPKVSDQVRYQSEHQMVVTNQLHELVPIDVFAGRLLRLADGTRDKGAILNELIELAKKGELVVQKDGKQLTDDSALREVLDGALEQRLALLPKSAILVG
jgi:methyltransferase-like protein/protein-L-isoaspartate O-methyltransferase